MSSSLFSIMHPQDRDSFTWHNYSEHLRETLKEMMTSSEFADVTLVTDDKQHIRAHRNILSASSPVFKNILQLNSGNTHPVIYLRGIDHSEMKSIMQFIYLGEARFYQDRINEFLMVSKNLEIKELLTDIKIVDHTASNEENNEPENVATEVEDVNEDPEELLTAPEIDDQTASCKESNEPENISTDVEDVGEEAAQSLNDDSLVTSTKTFKPLIRSNMANKGFIIKTEGKKYVCNECDFEGKHRSNLYRHFQSVHRRVMYDCNQCNYQTTRQDSLSEHIRSVHEGVKYACNQCDYKSSRPHDMMRHIQSIHEGVKYSCNQCDYEATWQSNLKNHVKKKHM